MNRKSASAKPAGGEMKKPEETLTSLLEEIYEIENILEPFGGAEATALKSETDDHKKRLESLADSELSGGKLLSLKRDVGKIKQKATSLASTSAQNTRSLLSEEIGAHSEDIKVSSRRRIR